MFLLPEMGEELFVNQKFRMFVVFCWGGGVVACWMLRSSQWLSEHCLTGPYSQCTDLNWIDTMAAKAIV